MHRFFTDLNKLKPLALLLVISLLSTPFQLPAQCCYQPVEEELNCLPDNDCSRNQYLIIGGAALVGGVIGLIAGNSDHHHSSSGSRGSTGSPGEPGPTGPVGPVGPGPNFPVDSNQSLTFNLSFEIPTPEAITISSIGYTGTVTPFVTRPDGATQQGPAIDLVSFTGNMICPPILVDNPPFGNYLIGLQFTANSGPNWQDAYLSCDINASRDGSLTNLNEFYLSISNSGNQSQGTFQFTYASNIP